MSAAALHRRIAAAGQTSSVAALVHQGGFASESHASRAFVARFGYRPGRLRQIARRVDDGSDQTPDASRPTISGS